jgi:hypothetical protein
MRSGTTLRRSPRVWWLTPVIPATWETRGAGSKVGIRHPISKNKHGVVAHDRKQTQEVKVGGFQSRVGLVKGKRPYMGNKTKAKGTEDVVQVVRVLA